MRGNDVKHAIVGLWMLWADSNFKCHMIMTSSRSGISWKPRNELSSISIRMHDLWSLKRVSILALYLACIIVSSNVVQLTI